MSITQAERDCLRDLAKACADIAARPIMAERRARWVRHNRLERVGPMILLFPEGAWSELLPDASLRCTDPTARTMEWVLRAQIYQCHHFDSDNVVVAEWNVPAVIRSSGWGLEAKWHHSSEAGEARGFDPVILQPADLKRP